MRRRRRRRSEHRCPRGLLGTEQPAEFVEFYMVLSDSSILVGIGWGGS